MATTTNVKQVKLNIMTQSQYNSATKNANELYMLTDATILASEVSGLSAVATSGSYNDLLNKPTIPTVNNPTITITQGGVTKGSFTLNQSSGDTIALDAGGSVKTFDLFDHKWSDYQLNDQSWLRADTFSWQDGTVYSDAYNHLEDDYSNGTSTTETVGSYTITYVLADDGHKITTDETNAANIYNESGVAWYYVLDTVNQRFKLPRTKYGFTGLRDTVGKYVKAGLPNITGDFATGVATSATGIQNGIIRNAHGAFSLISDTNTRSYASSQSTTTATYHLGANFNASSSNSIYGNSTTVQPPATQMYLYFYVGQFSQTATEQTAGLNSELFNGKADLDLGNLQDSGIRKTVRTGMIIPYDGSSAPSGWRKCNGNAISRTTYADLFAVIGTTYGAGDGSTTFNVPTANDFPSGYPSNSYSSVTVGSTGTIYTADKNGWYSFSGQATANGQYILIRNGNSSSAPRFVQVYALNGQYISLSIPARKGDKVKIEYSVGSTLLRFFEDAGSDCIIKT